MQDQDTLTIYYLSKTKLCSTGNAAFFFPPLPVGVVGEPGTSWTGKAVVTNGSVAYSTTEWDKGCSAAELKDVTPGTIKIGSGK